MSKVWRDDEAGIDVGRLRRIPEDARAAVLAASWCVLDSMMANGEG